MTHSDERPLPLQVRVQGGSQVVKHRGLWRLSRQEGDQGGLREASSRLAHTAGCQVLLKVA